MKLIKRLLLAGFVLAAIATLALFIVAARQETGNLEEARANANGQFISLKGGLTHYKLSGIGKPVILIHGGGITGMEVWDKNAAYLTANGYRVLQYDLYGRGYSDRTNGDYTPELLLNQLTALTSALGLKDSLTIISMSMGSMVAIDFATQHPDKIKSLVMIDPAITGEYRPSKLLKLPVISNFLMTLYWYPRALENQRKEFVDMQVFETYAKRLAYFMNFKGYKYMNYSTWMHTMNINKSEQFANLKTNSLLLLYGEKDPYFSASYAAKLKALFPRTEIIPVAAAGHMPHFERPDLVNPLLLDFLKR